MMPHKDEISLIVESHYSSSFKLRILREHRSQESPHSHTHHTIEVVQNELWLVICGYTMMEDILGQSDICDFEHSQPPINLPDQQLPPPRISNHNHMRVVHIFRKTVYLIQFEVLPGIVVDILEKDH